MIKTTLLIACSMFTLAAAAAYALERPAPPTAEEIARYARARAVIKTRFGTMTARFFPEIAPIHVKNFLTLAEKGFYNGTTFHRVIPGFMIQGGDPQGSGMGGPGYTIPAEFTDKKKHLPGILSMARSRDPNSAGSQFFVMVAPAPFLDGQYSIFGELTEGLEVAQQIVSVPRNSSDKPNEPVTMEVSVQY